MLTRSDHPFFSHVRHGHSQMRKIDDLNWDLIYALTVNFGLWFLIIRGVQFLVSRNPFG